MADGKRKQI
jgi:hypothetical protein